MMKRKTFIKRTYLKLAKEHKAKCDDAYCGVELYHLVEGLKALEIELTKKQLEVFL